MPRVFATSCLAVTLAFGASQFPAAAQEDTATDTQAETGLTLGKITVNAQKREESAQDVPITLNAFTPDIIDERGLDSISDLANQLPGVQFSEFSGSGNVSIRGVGTSIVSGTGENSVAVHIDNIFLTQPKAFTMIQEDLGSVEVLKGPQGTLYGRNSTGGVINFFSAAPSSEFGAGVSLLAGNYDRYKATGYITGSLAENVRARLSVQVEERGGYAKNLATGQELEDLSARGGRFSLDASPSANWDAALRISYRKEDFAGPVYDSFDGSFAVVPSPLSALDPREVNSVVNYDSSKELTLVSLKNTFELSDTAKLVSITGYSDFEETGLFDGVGSLVSVPIDRKQTSEAFTQEFNLVGDTDRLDWLLGLYYLHEDIASHADTDFSSFSALPFGSIIQANVQSSTKTSYSVFADATYSVSDRTRVFGGIRWIQEEIEQDLLVTTAGFELCSPMAVPQENIDSDITGRFGLQYDASDNTMLYGQLSRGYKVGGYSQSTCNNPFKPETIDAIEAGMKGDFHNGRVKLNAAAFYYDYSNLQLEQATPTGIPVVNAPSSHVYGVDLELVALLTKQFSIDALVSLLDSEYDDFINTDPLLGAPPGMDLSGIALNYAPSYSLLLGADYDFGLPGGGNLKFRGEVYVTDQYQIREFEFPWTTQDGFTQVNAYVTWTPRNDRFRARAFIKNATDEDVLGGVLGFGGALGSFQPPQTYGIELSADF